jgi:hypothetical protein
MLTYIISVTLARSENRIESRLDAKGANNLSTYTQKRDMKQERESSPTDLSLLGIQGVQHARTHHDGSLKINHYWNSYSYDYSYKYEDVCVPGIIVFDSPKGKRYT